jgi:hypothetical protein
VWIGQAQHIIHQRQLPILNSNRYSVYDVPPLELQTAVVRASRLQENLQNPDPKVTVILEISSTDVVYQFEFLSTPWVECVITLHDSGMIACWDIGSGRCIAICPTTPRATLITRHYGDAYSSFITVQANPDFEEYVGHISPSESLIFTHISSFQCGRAYPLFSSA